MNSNSIIGKLDLIKAHITTYEPEIICITETKVDSRFDDNELFGDSYTVIRKDRKFKAGGVLIAFLNNASFKVLGTNTGPGESATIKIQPHAKLTFNLIVMYRPPQENNIDILSQLITDDKNYQSILVGDFNLPDIEWNPHNSGKVKPHSNRKRLHQEALDRITESKIVQLINEPTHKSGNTLDLVLVNKVLLDEIYIKCTVLPYMSDHNMILLTMTVQDCFQTNVHKPCKIYKFLDANYCEIETSYRHLLDSFSNGLDIDSMYNAFCKTSHDALSTIPCFLPKPKGHPWITRKIKSLIRKRDRVYARYKMFPSLSSREELENIKKSIRIQCRKAKTTYQNRLSCLMEGGNTKPLYNYMNRSKGQSNYISSLQDTPSDQIANRLAEHFSSVFHKCNHEYPLLKERSWEEMNKIIPSRNGVLSLLMKLEPRKAYGPDNISPMMLKMFSTRVPSFVDCVFQIVDKSLQTGCVPQAWTKATICPVFKGGCREEAGNYRPISLTCILSKVTEHIIVSNMWKHINQHDLLSDKQHGFRPQLNTTTQLLHVTHLACKALDEQLNYHIISFDFSKAFDKVPHELLLYKLKFYRFNSNCILWIKNWLLHRTSAVTVNGLKSQEIDVLSGVPQGSVLGPLLFLLYVNDIADEVENADCRLYADDTLLSMNIDDQCSEKLQKNVDTLSNWAKSWGMLFNAKKCVHMQINRSSPDFRVKLNGEFIPTSDELKYLGLLIQSDLKWQKHIYKIEGKANKALGNLKRTLSDAPVKTKLLGFKSIVQPILEYGSQIWSPYLIGLSKSLDSIQRKAIRWIFRLKKHDSVTDCMERNNIPALSCRRTHLDLVFLQKIEAGLFDVRLSDYIQASDSHNTRSGTVSYSQRTNQWKNSFFNRMRSKIKVFT